MPKISIIHEDAWGKLFYKRLISKMKHLDIIPNHLGLQLYKNPADCNSKLDNILHLYNANPEIIGILIIRDGDNKKDEKMRIVQSHIPNNLETPYEILIYDSEIEELILLNQGLNRQNKPSKYLKNQGYRKSKLPDEVSKFDLEIILAHPVINDIVDFFNQFA